METEAQHADHQVAHVVDELQVQEDILERFGEGATVPHDTD